MAATSTKPKLTFVSYTEITHCQIHYLKFVNNWLVATLYLSTVLPTQMTETGDK